MLVSWTRQQGDHRCHPFLGFSSLIFQRVRAEVKLNESRQFLGSSKAIRPTYCTQTGWDMGLRKSLADLASDSSHGAYQVGRSKSIIEPNVEAHTWGKPALHRRQEMGLSESWNALPSFHRCHFKGPDLLTLPATPGCVILAISKYRCAEHAALAYKENRGQAELCCSESLPLIPPCFLFAQ